MKFEQLTDCTFPAKQTVHGMADAFTENYIVGVSKMNAENVKVSE